MVYDKQNLILLDISTFFECHAFKESLNTSTHLYKLLGTHTAYVVAIYLDIFHAHRLYRNHRSIRRLLLLPCENDVRYDYNRNTANHRNDTFLSQSKFFYLQNFPYFHTFILLP